MDEILCIEIVRSGFIKLQVSVFIFPYSTNGRLTAWVTLNPANRSPLNKPYIESGDQRTAVKIITNRKESQALCLVNQFNNFNE